MMSNANECVCLSLFLICLHKHSLVSQDSRTIQLSLIIPTLDLRARLVDKQAPQEVGPGQNLDLDGK